MFNTTSYTPQETVTAVELYKSGKTPIEIAEILNRTPRSVISKLTYEGVYVSPVVHTSRLKKPDLVIKIAEVLDLDPVVLESLTKSTHEALSILLETLMKKHT